MNKKLFIAVAASACIATPALAAPASGTVDVTGSVASKCTTAAGISGTITLGELALDDGKVDTAFSSNTGGLSRSFTVRCTAASVQISVNSNALTHASDAGTANGYTGTVHYTSTLTAKKAAGGDDASAVYTTANTLPAATVTSLGGRLKNEADNVTLTVSNGHTTNAGDLLKAGTSYTSTITISVSPV